MKIVGGLALATLLAISGPAGGAAPARPAGAERPIAVQMTEPDWRVKPSAAEVAREYPIVARLMGVGGSARIGCQVEHDGRLDQCHVLDEDPPGLGFGAAALRLTAYFTMSPATADGRPVLGRVVIPIRFAQPRQSPSGVVQVTLPPPDPQSLASARRILSLQDAAGRLRRDWSDPDREAAEVAASPDRRASQRMLDAFHRGLDDAVADEMERRARVLARRMTPAALKATVSYLESAAGRGWMAGEEEAQLQPKDFGRRLALAARAHLCGRPDCDGGAAPESPAKAGPP